MQTERNATSRLMGRSTLEEIRSAPPIQGIEQLLSQAEVCRVVGVAKCTIYNWIRRGCFPSPIRIGPRRVAWTRSAIETWLAERQAA